MISGETELGRITVVTAGFVYPGYRCASSTASAKLFPDPLFADASYLARRAGEAQLTRTGSLAIVRSLWA